MDVVSGSFGWGQVREGHNAELRRLEELAAANQRGNPAGTLEDRIGMKREHVIEKLLTLRCPNPACEVAFLDFEGCLALKCSACGTGFCAFCECPGARDGSSTVNLEERFYSHAPAS